MNYPCKDNLIELAEMAKDAEFLMSDFDKDGDLDTFCNMFVNDFAKGMGCEDFQGLMANQIVGLLENSPEEWTPLDQDWERAQFWSNQGYLIVYGAKAKGHGHVCVGVPGELTYSKNWGCKVPSVANVGSKNFTEKPLSFAWGADKKSTVKAWAWKGPKKEEKMPETKPLTENVGLNLPPLQPVTMAGLKEGKSTTEFKIAWGSFLLGVGQVVLGVAAKLVPVLAPLASAGLIDSGSEMALGALGIYGGARVVSKAVSDAAVAYQTRKK
jgi:hypothetical protein